jgi:hypothetical protein
MTDGRWHAGHPSSLRSQVRPKPVS